MEFVDIITQRFQNLIDRIGSYSPWSIAFELLVIALVVWTVVRFFQGTRAAGALKGMLLILVVGTLVVRVAGAGESFTRLAYLYDRFLAIVALALVVIFQPELRRALIRLGETPIFRSGQTEAVFQAAQIAPACAFLAKARFGALIVIERQYGLKSLIEGGTVLNANLSGSLLQTIFYPGSALHDLAVVVKGRQVLAAGVQLPMADPSDMPDPQLGSRHRAGVGVAKDSDALVVIISEETGQIRLADRGRLSRAYAADELEREIAKRLGQTPPPDDGESAKEHAAEDEGLDATPLDAGKIESTETRESA